MKVEKRKKVIETEVYVCSDGTEFETKWEAEDYENELMKESFLMIDLHYEKTQSFEEACFVKLRTKEELENFNLVNEDYSHNLKFHEVGYYCVAPFYACDKELNMGKAIRILDELDKSGS